MEHLLDVEEREPTVQSINEDVLGMSPSLPKCCIYRVHERLRKVKPEAYKPKLVSIGPYHLQNGKLQEMKKHKQRYLHLLLNRRGEESVERYILALRDLEGRARECYADPIDLSSEKFLEMMLLDGFFVIEFSRKLFYRKRLIDDEDPILNVAWMLSQISSDIMLLENQLPFFILSRLYDMAYPDNELRFIKAMSTFRLMVPRPRRSPIPLERYNIEEIKHLLHLLHNLCCPLPIHTSSENKNKITRIRCVEELSEGGVEFKKVGESDTETPNLLDIKFRKGSMEIPCFTVSDSTETIFRNLIAYEQHSWNDGIQYFTDFASFMNQLIDTENDVKLLCGKKIIVNCLGDDKDVCDLFNKLHDGLVVSSYFFYYDEVCRKVSKHCNKHRYRVMEKLRHDYFNNPWAGVSTIAAAVLLLLTLLQTIAALKAM